MSPIEMKALGNIVRNETINNPLTRLAVRYWWLSIPVGIAVWGRFEERRAAGEVKLHHLIGDAGTILSPFLVLAILSEFAERREEAAKRPKPPSPQAQSAPQGYLPTGTKEQ